MDAIGKMVDETKLLRQHDRKKVMDELEEEYPNVNEEQLENKTDELMKEHYVDTFTHLLQRNISFCWNLLHSDLGQRILERKEQILNEEDVDSDNEEELLLDAVSLSREYIEDLF